MPCDIENSCHVEITKKILYVSITISVTIYRITEC